MPAARSTPAVIPATTTTAAPTPLRQVRARTTKANQKLVVLSDGGEDGAELLEERVRRRQTLLPQGHADAGRSTDAERGITETKQQRLVAYCTCREYRRAWTHIERKIHTYFAEDAERRRIRRRTSAVALDGMSHAYADAFGYAPMERFEVHLQRFDECSYIRVQRQVAWTVATGTEQPPPSLTEIFVMDYGATVFWGAESAAEEREFLRRFLQVVYVEPIAEEEQEQEELWFEEKAGRTPKIYNNVVVLNAHSPDNIMRKVTISMVIAQSVKLAQFERLVDECIDTTEHIPHVLARDGFIRMSRTESLQAIGKLFHVVCSWCFGESHRGN